ADDIESDENQPALAQFRADNGGYFAVPIRKRLGYAASSRSQIAASFTDGGNARQAIGNRLAVDHQYSLVTVLDGRDIALRHDLPGAMLGQDLQNYRQVRVAFAMPENRRAAHLIQWFENDVTMFPGEFA